MPIRLPRYALNDPKVKGQRSKGKGEVKGKRYRSRTEVESVGVGAQAVD